MQAPLPIIRPISDLHAHLNDVCAQARETQEPVILTKNGSPAFVLSDAAAYDAERQRMREYLALREAEIEERYRPESISAEEANRRMSKIFEMWGLEYAGA